MKMNMPPGRDIDVVPVNAEPGASDGLDFVEALRVLQRRARLIAAAAFLVAAIVIAGVMTQTRLYTASAQVMISPRQERVVSGQEVMSGLSPDSAVIASEIEVIRSRQLIGRLVDQLELTKASALRPPSLLQTLRQAIGLESAGSDASPEARQQRLRDSAIDGVIRQIAVSRQRVSYVIEIRVTNSNPRLAQRMANALIDLYFQSQLEAKYDAAQRANKWLSERSVDLREELRIKEAAIEQYRAAQGLLSTEGVTLTERQATELQTSVIAARADLAEKEARYRQVQEMMGRGGSADSLGGVLGSATIQRLREQEAESTRRQTDLEARLGELHPNVQRGRLELADVRRQIQEEVQRIVNSLRNEVDVARARLGALTSNTSALRSEIVSNNTAQVRLRELERDATATRTVLEGFLKRFQEVAEQETMGRTDAQLVAYAALPRTPTSPNLRQGFLMAVFLGLLIGVLLAYLMEALDDVLNTSEDFERRLGAAALATIPIVRKKEFSGLDARHANPPGFLASKPMSAYSEALRVLRAALVFANIDERQMVVAVTSAVAGEGKTTTSIALARIAALSGQRVLVVDCDLRRRSLEGFVPSKPSTGLLQALSGEIDWRQAVVKDDVTDAQILLAGESAFTPRDVFGSDAMGRLLAEFRNSYDLVICDCAPVLAVAETRTIARRADCAIVVAKWAATPRKAVAAALRQLKDSGVVVSGIVLNGMDPRLAGGRAGYYDGAYFGKKYAYGDYYQK
jgi:exopolysaccharide transport family protein